MSFQRHIIVAITLRKNKYQRTLATLKCRAALGLGLHLIYRWYQDEGLEGAGEGATGRTGSQEVCNFIDLSTWAR